MQEADSMRKLKFSLADKGSHTSYTTKKHKEHARVSVNAAILTMSNTRTIENDDSGKLIKDILTKNQHKVTAHMVILDNKDIIKENVLTLIGKEVDLIITNGGTGLSKQDVTIEAIKPLFEKELVSFNPLFAKLSYEYIGSAALVSRAAAGTVKNTAIFCLPGSPKACELAMNKLIIPEIRHIVKHLKD